MAEHVYKSLPDGGYTSVPVQSAVDRARKLREGWSTVRPAAPEPPAPEFATVTEPDGGVVLDAPKRRGRRPAESVS